MSLHLPPDPRLDETWPSEPHDVPIEGPDGQRAPSVLICTELGIPIFFSPDLRQFWARLGSPRGRGSTSFLKSPDFSLLLAKIRARALVVPVQAYRVYASTLRGQVPTVEVTPCLVVEYHERRAHPYVIRITEPDRRSGASHPHGSVATRVYQAEQVHLPTPASLERYRASLLAIAAEEARHEAAMAGLVRERVAAYAAIPILSPQDVRFVQREQLQQARSAADLGAVVYTAEADHPDEPDPGEPDLDQEDEL